MKWQTHGGNVLNLVCTNVSEGISVEKTEPFAPNSGHSALEVKVNVLQHINTIKPAKKLVYNYKKANIVLMKSELNKINWKELLRNLEVNESTEPVDVKLFEAEIGQFQNS